MRVRHVDRSPPATTLASPATAGGLAAPDPEDGGAHWAVRPDAEPPVAVLREGPAGLVVRQRAPGPLDAAVARLPPALRTLVGNDERDELRARMQQAMTELGQRLGYLPRAGDTRDPTQRARPFDHGVALSMSLASAALMVDIVRKTHNPLEAVAALGAAVLGYEAADVASGAFHWAIDNYDIGNHEPFTDHHVNPKRLTEADTVRLWSSVARYIAPVLGAAAIASVTGGLGAGAGAAAAEAGLLVFANLIAGAQVFHKWTHVPTSEVPPLVHFLQEHGVIMSRAQHMRHHDRQVSHFDAAHPGPHTTDYAFIRGRRWPEPLFRAAENTIEKTFGVVPEWKKMKDVLTSEDATIRKAAARAPNERALRARLESSAS